MNTKAKLEKLVTDWRIALEVMRTTCPPSPERTATIELVTSMMRAVEEVADAMPTAPKPDVAAIVRARVEQWWKEGKLTHLHRSPDCDDLVADLLENKTPAETQPRAIRGSTAGVEKGAPKFI